MKFFANSSLVSNTQKTFSLLYIRRSHIVMGLFYISLFCYSFLSSDVKRTITISQQDNLYLQINSLIFLIIGIILTTINIKRNLKIPMALMISGPIFVIYWLINIAMRINFSQIHNTMDIFYSIIELLNIALPITIASCFTVYSFINKKLYSLYTLSIAILIILVFYVLAIYFFDLIIPTIKKIFELEISIDAFAIGIDRTIGYRRLYGPLGGSTSLGFILIPISGYFLHLYKNNSRIVYIGIISLASILLIMTASRAAILGQSFLILSYLLMRKRLFINITILSFLLLVFTIAGTSISLPEKLNPFKAQFYSDSRRITALKTSLNAWLSTPASFLFGADYNELPLLSKDWNLASAEIIKPELIINTKYGILFRGPHSIFNWTISGTGLIGFIIRCSFIYFFIYSLFRRILKIKSKEYLIFPFSILFSMIILFTDDLHVIYPMLMTCWFIFYIYAYRMINAPKNELSKFQ
ncbi:MAG: hypothetical protein ACFFDN_06265 [Candidatus Hodarchaeota archaeon]